MILINNNNNNSMIAAIYYSKQHVHRNHICQILYKFVCWQYDWSLPILSFLRNKKGCQVGRDQDKIDANCCILHDCGVCLTEQTHEFVWSLLLIIKKRPLNNSANYKMLQFCLYLWVALRSCGWLWT